MNIRQYEPADFGQVLALSLKDSYESPIEAEFKTFLSRTDKEHIIVEIDGKVISLLSITYITDHEEKGLYFFGLIDTDYYGKDIGVILYRHVLERVRAKIKAGQQLSFLRASCDMRKEKVIRFFTELGGIIVNFYQTMEIDLANFALQATFSADFRLKSFCEQEDIEAYFQLETEVFADHFTYNQISFNEFRNQVTTPFFQHDGTFLLCKDDQFVGFCRTHFHDKEISTISMLGVKAEFRNQGLGTNLLIYGLNYLKARGAYKSMLAVDGNNEQAFSLYQRLGFQVCRQRCIFEKKLNLRQVELELWSLGK